MNIKLSRIALALMASVSFSALANNVVSGSEVIAEADIVVNADSNLSLTITPIAGLTVSDINKGAVTKVANMNLTGTNLAVRMINAVADYPYCAVSFGNNNPSNTMQICLGEGTVNNFVYNGFTYYPVSEGSNYLRAGNDNAKLFNVGPDTYRVMLELVQYTL
ncbi:hypothetical protein BVJ60_17485 [Vibrio cholerae]|uniref:hypothetical protein n=2 Tax=Vibrio cholerae TaxID=666 RepID=UPI001A9F35D3|nr:hypothetical protein [Vibrio cholerae]MBO1386553.1 hypothetical protein [Vibrio cholerae]WOQ88828.1 hypothetical protein R4535_06915 [Vibrio cholerae]